MGATERRAEGSRLCRVILGPDRPGASILVGGFGPPTPAMTLTKLRLLLLAHGEHQYIIAAKARINPARLSEYANGKRRIPPANLARLCVVLRCSPEDIVGNENPADHYVT